MGVFFGGGGGGHHRYGRTLSKKLIKHLHKCPFGKLLKQLLFVERLTLFIEKRQVEIICMFKRRIPHIFLRCLLANFCKGKTN